MPTTMPMRVVAVSCTMPRSWLTVLHLLLSTSNPGPAYATDAIAWHRGILNPMCTKCVGGTHKTFCALKECSMAYISVPTWEPSFADMSAALPTRAKC